MDGVFALESFSLAYPSFPHARAFCLPESVIPNPTIGDTDCRVLNRVQMLWHAKSGMC